MLFTHICFYNAKARHTSPAPHLSSSSHAARVLQHRAMACALQHQASASLSSPATPALKRLLAQLALHNNTTYCLLHEKHIQALHRLRKNASAPMQHDATGVPAPLTAVVARRHGASSPVSAVHKLKHQTTISRTGRGGS